MILILLLLMIFSAVPTAAEVTTIAANYQINRGLFRLPANINKKAEQNYFYPTSESRLRFRPVFRKTGLKRNLL